MYTTNRCAKYPDSAYFWESGACPSRKFLKIRCQKSEFGCISATKITCIIQLKYVASICNNGPYGLVYILDFNITIIHYKGAIVAMPNKSSHIALSQTTS